MLRRERLSAPEDRDIALVLSDDRFVCRLILGNSAPMDMDSSIPDNGYWLPCERVSMRQDALLHHRSNLLARCDLCGAFGNEDRADSSGYFLL
jgi:hypothetical protein